MAGEYLNKMFGLDGKTAVVTGGAGVLGSGMAAALARAGADVILWDIREDALKEAAAAIDEAAGRTDAAAWRATDLMNEDDLRAAVAEAGDFQILLNGCGGNRGKSPLVETDMANYEFVLKLNLIAGCFLPTKIVAAKWIESGVKGAVINIASMSSYVPLSGVWAYDAAKAAVMNQTMAAAAELAPHGIRVNAIAPGFFLGEQNRRLLTNEDGTLTERGRQVIDHTPYGRFGEPGELMGTILFLASNEAAGFVTGVTVPVDGGYLVHNI